MKKILLLSAYHAASHQRWCKGLMDYFSDWQWVLESLPARFFNWRYRGNSLTWAFGDYPSLDEQYDLILATSMVDLAGLRGLKPNLANSPTIVYFHENQFAFPTSRQQQSGLLEIQLTSIYTALAADAIVFNSNFNRQSFLDGAGKLLEKMPDFVPDSLLESIASRTVVLPVPLESELFSIAVKQESPSGCSPIELLWNHRWEWDKGPDRLLLLIKALAERGLLGARFKLNVVGEQFRSQPTEFEAIKVLLEGHQALGRWGFINSVTDYRNLMLNCDAVLSTATQDFQGLAVLEAALMGCLPIVPDRLAYREWFEPNFRYRSCLENPQLEAESLALHLDQIFPSHHKSGCGNKVSSMGLANSSFRNLSWQKLGLKYRELFERLL